MKIEKRNPSELIPAEYNPRTLNSKQRSDITASLEEFGFVDPIIVNQHPDRKDVIVGGHQRCKVAQEIGYDEVPCTYVNLTLEKERELNVRLNKNTGDWDWDALEEYFEQDELIEWGFEESDFFSEEEEKEPDLTDISDELDLEYKLEIELENEDQQESLYNRLTEEGFKCRILTL